MRRGRVDRDQEIQHLHHRGQIGQILDLRAEIDQLHVRRRLLRFVFARAFLKRVELHSRHARKRREIRQVHRALRIVRVPRAARPDESDAPARAVAGESLPPMLDPAPGGTHVRHFAWHIPQRRIEHARQAQQPRIRVKRRTLLAEARDPLHARNGAHDVGDLRMRRDDHAPAAFRQ